MGTHIWRYLWLCILLCPLVVKAQVVETRPYVDTLSTSERISLRTNAVDWLLLVPNIGVEYDVKNLNWNRWTVGMNLRFRPASTHTFKPGIVYNVAEARLEVRNYYRIRPFDGHNIVRQKHIWNRLLSPRRPESRHPTTTYYRGVFVAYNNYSIKFGDEGKQGNAIIGGVMWGMVKPLYEFPSGNSLDLEMGIGVGAAFANYDTYTHDRMDDCYPLTGHKSTIMPVINDLHVGFVYRFGKYPVTKKYRWRYDVDLKYQDMVDSVIAARKMERNHQAFMDSLDATARKMFWEKYDSIAPHNKAKNDSIRQVENAQKAAQKKEAEAAKQAEKQAEKELKAKQKQEEKDNKNKKPENDSQTEQPQAEQPEVETPPAEEPQEQTAQPEETPQAEQPQEETPQVEEQQEQPVAVETGEQDEQEGKEAEQ